MSDYSPFRAGHHYIQKAARPSSNQEMLKIYREQYEEWPRKGILGDFPTHLDLELSSACNLHCPMCHTLYIDDPSFKKFKEKRLAAALMDFELFKKAIDEAVMYGHFYSIKLNLRGESTLHPDIVRYIQYAKQSGVFDIMLNTNGNFEPGTVTKMVEAGLTWLSISLDAIRPETYAKVRAGGNFYSAYASAMEMCQHAGKLNIQVSFVIQKTNQEEADEFKAFWQRMPVNKIVMADFYNPGELIKNDAAFATQQYERLEKFTCPQLWQRIVIWNDGRMYPCCHSFEGAEDMYLGNLRDITIHDAWLSPKLQAIREHHRTGDYSAVATCSKCAYPKQPSKGGVDSIVSG